MVALDSCIPIKFHLAFLYYNIHYDFTRSQGSARRNNAMQFMIIVDRDEGSVWITKCSPIPGRMSQGQTEVLANIREAI